MIFKKGKGASTTEMGLMLGLIAVAIILAVRTTGTEIADLMQTTGNALEENVPSESEQPANALDIPSVSDTTNAGISATVESQIVLVGGQGTETVTAGSGATFRACSDASCASPLAGFAASGAVTAGQYLQMQATASNAADTEVTFSLSSPSSSVNWSVRTLTVAYARARHSRGNRDLIFLALPSGTTITSNSQYRAFCEAAGFNQNLNNSSNQNYINAGMGGSSTYYCDQYCCYLGSGNSEANNLSGFQNFGLPQNTHLRVRDRGCGNYSNSTFNAGQNTTDSLNITGSTSFTYSANHFGGRDFDLPSPNSFTEAGVIVCQE